jgi:branched-chain amino acid transport system substrate-binding protein
MKKISIIVLAVFFLAAIALSGCEQPEMKKDESKAAPKAPAPKTDKVKVPEPKKEGVTAPEPKAPEGGANVPGGDKKEESPKAGEKKAGDPIKIGAIFSVTGGASSLGLPEKQTLEMMVEQINKKGVLGRKLEVIIYDDKSEEAEAVTLAKRLISTDKVKAIIGPTQSGTSMNIIKDVTEAKIPNISCAASYKIVTDENGKAREWIFKTPQSDSMAVEKLYEYYNKNNISKVAIMTVSNGYGESGRAELVRLAPNFKIELTAQEKFGPDDVDMSTQLTKIKSTKPQAVIVWSIQKPPAIIAKNYKTLGLTFGLFQSHGVANMKFIELCGDAANGQILPAGRLIVVDQLPDSDRQKALCKKYKTDFEAKYGKGQVSTFGGHAYDAITMLVKAIETAGADDPAKVKDALEKIKDFPGTGGIFNMSPTDHNGLTKDAFVMVKIENNTWKMISP